MQTLTQYLSNIMTTTLLGLPPSIKGLIYYNALSHASTSILSLPISPTIKRINPNGVAALAMDVRFLSNFVETLNIPILEPELEGLRQTVELMSSERAEEEWFDAGFRNKKYDSVNPAAGTALLEK